MKFINLIIKFTMKTFRGIAAIEGNIAISPFSIRNMVRSISLTKNIDKEAKEIKGQLENKIFKSKHILLHTPYIKETGVLDQFDTSCLLDETKLKLIKYQRDQNFLDKKIDLETEGIFKKAINYLDPNMDLILLNSVEFDLQWKHKFNIKNTALRGFYINGILKDVPTMSLSKQIYVTKSQDYKVAIIPFENDYAFMGVLPNEGKNLVKIHDELSKKDKLNSLIPKCGLRTVTLRIPKFIINYEINITDRLTELKLNGLESMKFVNELEIKKIKMIQKVKIAINELGTSDEYFTGINGEYKSSNVNEDSDLIFNRPFLFYIIKRFNTGKDKEVFIPLLTGKFDGTEHK